MLASVNIIASSEMTRAKPYGKSAGSNNINLSREIYANLSSLMKSSEIAYHAEPRSKFEEFMKDFNDLYETTSDLTDEQKAQLEIVNNFLGSLGIDIDYPLVQDRVGNQKTINATYHKLNKGNEDG